MSDSPIDDALAAARAVRARASAPYSNFQVGAALVGTDRRIHAGCNVESASYGLTICAERVALFNALSAGEIAFSAVVIVADTPQATAPCGACRQVLWEYCGDVRVVLANLTHVLREHRLRDLLPHPFVLR